MKEFNNIYKQNYPVIYRLVSRFIADKHEIQDIVQEVFVKLYLQNKEEKVEFPKTWLYRVASNLCINTVKRRKELVNIDKINSSDHLSSDDLEARFMAGEQGERLQKCLLSLEDRDRLILILYADGLSYKEIAEISGIKFTSVGKLLSRALEKLKPLVKGQYNELFNK